MRKVTYARFQTELYVPGAGGLGTTLPSQNKTLDNLTLNADGSFLYIDFTYRGIKENVGVPLTNVSLIKFAPAPVESIATVVAVG